MTFCATAHHSCGTGGSDSRSSKPPPRQRSRHASAYACTFSCSPPSTPSSAFSSSIDGSADGARSPTAAFTAFTACGPYITTSMPSAFAFVHCFGSRVARSASCPSSSISRTLPLKLSTSHGSFDAALISACSSDSEKGPRVLSRMNV